MPKKLEINCPSCKRKFIYSSSEFRPFCCERCKMVDLGNWLEENYKVPGISNTVYVDDPTLIGLEDDDDSQI